MNKDNVIDLKKPEKFKEKFHLKEGIFSFPSLRGGISMRNKLSRCNASKIFSNTEYLTSCKNRQLLQKTRILNS
jgi:hypothetical protein